MSNFHLNDGMYRSALSILSLAGCYYLYDTINDCKLKDVKTFKVLFVTLTMVIYINIEIWFSGLIDLNNTDLNHGDFGENSKLVRDGIPYITKDYRHESYLWYKVPDNLKNISLNGYGGKPEDVDKRNEIMDNTLSLQKRNMIHFVFSGIVASLFIAIFNVTDDNLSAVISNNSGQ